jgi:lipoate-protein ligase A
MQVCGSIVGVSSGSVLNLYRSDGPPEADLAREAWLIERSAGGEICLFLTSWRDPVVVLGYGQPATDVDLGWCRSRHVPVLRRLTGGTGVVHRGDLGVGLVLPQDHSWAQGIISLYGRFLEVLEPALGSLGADVSRLAEPRRASRVRSPICFLDQLADTLVVDGRKAVGCAQTRRKGAVLIHAAVLLNLDAELYSRVFGVRAEEVAGGLAPAFPGGDPGGVGEAIAAHLAEALGLEIVERALEPVPERFLEPYTTERWAPVKF